ncbi:MAG TPA: DUF1570 domain-containing protein [Kofleriaceae bacterium]|nr:DUF1570 domain-containing protein [Kofleriaceae bacterium]
MPARVGSARAAALVALVAAACGPAIPPVPGKGGPAWRELTSAHFRLWTDASSRRAHTLIRQMEHLRQVVYGMAFPDLPGAGQSFVVALRDGDEVGAFVPEQFQAYASFDDTMRQPMIVYAADTDESDGHVIAHELTHVISWNAIHHQPAWFAEGLAQFFETVQLDVDRKVVDVGAPLDTIVNELRFRRLKRAEEVMACEQVACKDDRFYVTVWAIYSFLANVRPAELARFQYHLDEVPDDPARAWRDVFPDLPPRALDAAVRDWLLNGKKTVWHFTVRLDDAATSAPAERALADADVYAVRAVLRHGFHPGDPQLARDVAAALALDPTQTIAWTIDAAAGHPPSADQARAMTAAHPDDWRAWWLLAGALDRKGREAEDALAHVCALAAQNPAVWSPWRCSMSITW